MNGPERRRYPRFDVDLVLKNFDINAVGEISAMTTNISSKGIGCVGRRVLPAGSRLDIWLYLPDGEPVHTFGRVAWAGGGEGKYIMGIELDREDLKPIPLVLRSIHMRSRYYS